MEMTGRRLITGAMRAIGVLEASETADAQEFKDGFELLNQMLDAFTLDRLLITHNAKNTYTLVVGQASYTIGPGGDFDQFRPEAITKARTLPDSTSSRDYSVEVYNLYRWARVSDKLQAGPYPAAIYYDHNYDAGLGQIELAPVPDVAGVRLVLWAPEPLTTFETVDTTYDLPPGYARMLRLNLAVEMAPEFASVDQALLAAVIPMAKAAKADVQSANLPEVELGMDAALLVDGGRRTFDIRTGE
jgi:hypothetical protein